MKIAKLVFPVKKAAEVAKFFAEQGIVTNLCYTTSDGFFSPQVVCHICFSDDKEDKVLANLKQYVQA